MDTTTTSSITSRFRRRRRVFGLVSALLAVAAGPAVALTSSSSSAGATVPSLFPQSVFDQSVAALPADASQAGLVSNLVNQYTSHYGTIGVNRMPIFTVPATQPLVPVSVNSGCWSFLSNTGMIPIPQGAYTSTQGDNDLIVNQPSTGKTWELWKAQQASNGHWSACWGGGLSDATSSGVFPYPFGLSATGISYMATTVTEADAASGQINHTIAMEVVNCNGWIAPANRGDCGSNSGTPPEGTWFRMPANTPMPAGLTPFAQMVFRALQTYGAVVVDHAGAVMVEAENSQDWAFQGGSGTDPITTSWAGKPQYAVLNGMPWSQLQVINP
jgi:hypothetical protein